MLFEEFLKEELKDPEVAKYYAEAQPEMEILRAIIRARAEQNLTQEELSKRTGIAQTEISRLEKGTRNPSIKLLQRLADGLDMVLQISFIPKSEYYKSQK